MLAFPSHPTLSTYLIPADMPAMRPCRLAGGAGRARADRDRYVCAIYTPMLFLMIQQVAVAFSDVGGGVGGGMPLEL